MIRSHDLAVVAQAATIGRPVGWAAAPPGALTALTNGSGPGYVICDPLPGGDRDGPVSDPWADIELIYGFRCIDRGPEGVRWLTDQLETVMTSLTVPGRSVMWVRPQTSGVWEDPDTANPSLFFSTPSFRVKTTP